MGVLGRLGRIATRNQIRQRDFNAIKEKLNYSLLDLPRNYFAGLVTSRANAQDIAIAAGQARNTGDTANILVTSAITKQIDANWAAGDAGGFPDTALNIAADTWYHVFVIGKADGSAYDAGFDSSISAANLLDGNTAGGAGFTTYRRVASVKTDDGASPEEILDYTQVANSFTPKLVENIALDDSLTDDTAENIVLLGCPIGHSVLVELNVSMLDANATETVLLISSLTQTDVQASFQANALANFSLDEVANENEVAGQLWKRTDTSATVRHRTKAGTGSADNVRLAVISWIDDLGQFD